jgi:MFS family permease
MDRPPPIKLLYFVEGLASIGGNLLQVGIFFYTNRQFGWGLRENFTLAATQGMVYVAGALLAGRIASRIPPRKVLSVLYVVLAAIALAALLANSPAGIVATVLAYTALMAIGWPILESLVSTGVDAHTLSKRISTYNVVWAGTGALIIAVNGAIIDYWPAGVFVLTGAVHLVSTALLLSVPQSATPAPAHEHVEPEPELLRVRNLALWLSRISMPASYALIYALSALLPSLGPMQGIPTWAATLVGSAWLVSRWVTFFVLGQNAWWHTRPRMLLVAAWLMLASFAVIAWQPSSAMPGSSHALAIDLGWLVLCQTVMGVAIGLIYSASLYFGMVLSEGSTEHGGYHEALIGLGSILGPGAGALAQYLRPGSAPAGVLAVSAVLLASTLLASGAAVHLSGRR